ncbi:MAG TPA: NADH-quinone oxidoreductase subunit NuoI [Thermodesulfobacteriota bacterium]
MIGELVKGLATSIKHIFRKPVTVQYPEEPVPISPRHRGVHQLMRYENGLERCIGCELCSAACPADCILVVSEENPPDKPVSPGERYAKIYEINMLRCIFCGYCQEACPTGAIVLTPHFEIAPFNKAHAIYTKERLLLPPAERPPEWEPLGERDGREYLPHHVQRVGQRSDLGFAPVRGERVGQIPKVNLPEETW